MKFSLFHFHRWKPEAERWGCYCRVRYAVGFKHVDKGVAYYEKCEKCGERRGVMDFGVRRQVVSVDFMHEMIRKAS